jgi:predicted small secreted protein
MKKLAIPAFAATVLLVAGCNKSSPITNSGASKQVTDWGVVEVAASTPK